MPNDSRKARGVPGHLSIIFMPILFEKIWTLEELKKEGVKKITEELLKEKCFILSLKGELGTGKTTLVKYLLQSLGYPKHLPVNSPTFAIVQEYLSSPTTPEGRSAWGSFSSNQQLFLHLDCYRLDQRTELDLSNYDDQVISGIFVEWLSQSPKILESKTLTHELVINYLDNQTNLRRYIFKEFKT